MSNKSKVLSHIKSGMSINELSKATGLTNNQVLNAIRNLQYYDDVNLSIKTETVKIQTVVLNV